MYEGEIWDKDHPTHVPIFPVEKRCHYQCCSRKQIPLEICWAKSLHNFQGSEAGKKKKGPDAIVLSPGDRRFEGNNPGALYSGASRADSLGSAGREFPIKVFR